jgi:hypothetical protein
VVTELLMADSQVKSCPLLGMVTWPNESPTDHVWTVAIVPPISSLTNGADATGTSRATSPSGTLGTV